MATSETTGVGQTLTPHLVYCWELGQGYGHVLNFRRLAVLLLDAGWQVSAVAVEPAKLRTILPSGVTVWPMPALKPERLFDPTLDLAEILLNNDFADATRLQQRALQWQQLLLRLQPAVLLIDHAPTALLTARLLHIPAVLIGTGFFIPPELTPLPAFGPFAGQQSNAQQRLLQTINQVQLAGRTAQLGSLAALFHDSAEQFLCTFPELDHYGVRADGNYWGAVHDFGFGVAPSWPAKPGRKVFMYLHADYPALSTVLAAVSDEALQLNVLVHIGHWRGNPADWPALTFSAMPCQLAEVAVAAELVICHAGHATIAGMLLRKMPLLLLPKQLEQLILSERLWQQQLALFIPLAGDHTLLPAMITTLCTDPGLKMRLQRFADYYHGFSVDEQAAQMLAVLNEVLAERAAEAQGTADEQG